MANQLTSAIELNIGASVRALRLAKNIDQKSLAEQAGISVRALKNLENGQGTTLKTFLTTIRALEHETWVLSIAPDASIHPLTMPLPTDARQRATPRKLTRTRPAPKS